VVIAPDGLPYSLLSRWLSRNRLPALAGLAEKLTFREINSEQPPVSSVAWASFMTGLPPEKHGILGFTYRDPQTMNWYVPKGDLISAPLLWEKLSRQGRRVFVMNVPMTWPPRPVNGLTVCGFVGNDLDTGAWPAGFGQELKNRGYMIDADVSLARKNRSAFLAHLHEVLDRRLETALDYYQRENWDFFMLHIMETDRLQHFFWDEILDESNPWHSSVFEIYQKVDWFLSRLQKILPEDTGLVLLSDHGFTGLKAEVNLNRWLWENGWLRFTKPVPQSLHDLHPESRAYALYPGRIYLNLKTREGRGCVSPGAEFEQLRSGISQKLAGLRHPQSAEKIIKKIYRPEEVYPSAEIRPEIRLHLPDLLAVAEPGFDLKGQLWSAATFDKTIHSGMHTFGDAFLLTNLDTARIDSIRDMHDCILSAYAV